MHEDILWPRRQHIMDCSQRAGGRKRTHSGKNWIEDAEQQYYGGDPDIPVEDGVDTQRRKHYNRRIHGSSHEVNLCGRATHHWHLSRL